ncbi:mechanosensitive ion channel family protein [Ruminococcus turbiniformis]
MIIKAATLMFSGAVLANVPDAADESVNDMIDTAASATADAAQDAAQDVNRLLQFLEDSIPALISFGIKVVLALIVFFIGGKVITWLRKIVRRSLERAVVDAGAVQFIDSVLKFGLYALLIIMIAMNFGVESSSVAALLASAGVAIGLAVQGSLSNFAGGVLILVLKPFEVGDYIIVTQEGIEGTVKEIQVFYTKLATVDNQRVVVPNSILTENSLTNVTARPERQLDLKIGISYDSDLKKAKEIIEGMLAVDSTIKQDEDVRVFVDSLGESAVVIGLRAWVATEDYWSTRWRLLEQIKVTFDEEGIEIPYNQLTVHLKGEGEGRKNEEAMR